jgi:hypothetical protein
MPGRRSASVPNANDDASSRITKSFDASIEMTSTNCNTITSTTTMNTTAADPTASSLGLLPCLVRLVLVSYDVARRRPGTCNKFRGHFLDMIEKCRNRADNLLWCASHLSSCAEHCPSILAGDDIALSLTMRTCMALVRHVPKIDKYDVNKMLLLRLMVLDVLATMYLVPDIRCSKLGRGCIPCCNHIKEQTSLVAHCLS